MKLTNPETILESEKEFIDTINAELDWEAIEQMLLEKHGFTLQEEIEYKAGDLVVHQNKIAYKFDFEIRVPLSVIFNRDGECLEVTTAKPPIDAPDDAFEPDEDLPGEPEEPALPQTFSQEDKVAQMASNIADMISEINQGDE